MSAISVTKETFHKEVMLSEKPVLVDFWAPWCNPCRMVSPLVDQIAEERSDIKVVKINIDEEAELARQFKIVSIPHADGHAGRRSGAAHQRCNAKSQDQCHAVRKAVRCPGNAPLLIPLPIFAVSFCPSVPRFPGSD